jgi:hypothetical protein
LQGLSLDSTRSSQGTGRGLEADAQDAAEAACADKSQDCQRERKHQKGAAQQRLYWKEYLTRLPLNTLPECLGCIGGGLHGFYEDEDDKLSTRCLVA